MANKQFVVLLLAVALTIIQNASAANVPKDAAEVDLYKTELSTNTSAKQQDLLHTSNDSAEDVNDEDSDFTASNEYGKNLLNKKIIIVVTTPSTTTTTMAGDTTTTTTTTTTPKPKRKGILALLDSDTRAKIRAEFIAHRAALEKILSDSGVGNKVQIVYQRRNLNSDHLYQGVSIVGKEQDEEIVATEHHIDEKDAVVSHHYLKN